MASSRSPHLDTPGAPSRGERRANPLAVLRFDFQSLPPAANDNPVPLRRLVRRIAFTVTTALALAWLFWVGVLR